MFSTFNNQQLPVSATDVNQQFYCPGAPNQVPFKNAFPDMVNGIVVHLLQENAFKNPLRIFLFNMASANGYQNDLYAMLVSSTTELAEALAVTTQGNTPVGLVTQAAGEVLSCATAMLATQYPSLQQMMGNGIEVEINRLLQRQQQIGALVQQVANQNQPQQQQGFNNNQFSQPQQQRGFNAPQGNSGWPYNTMANNNQPAPSRGNMDWGRYAGAASQGGRVEQSFNPNAGGYQGRGGLSAISSNPQQPAAQQRTEQSTTDTFAAGNGRSSSSKAAWPKRDTGIPGVIDEMFQDMGGSSMVSENAQQQAFARQVEAQRAKPEPYVEPEPVFVAPPVNQNPKAIVNADSHDPERPFDYLLMADGTEIRPAHQSGWTRTWSIEEPWDCCFNPNTHMKFHVRKQQDDGTYIVKEVIKAITPDEAKSMEYLQHEIRKLMPYKLDPSKKVVPVDWEQVATLGEPQMVREEDGAMTPVEDPEVKIIANDLTAHSFEEAEIKYLDEVIEIGSDDFDGAVREYSYRNMKPVNVDGNMIGVMVELSKKPTLSAAAKFLREHQENEEITPRLYTMLNKELTARVNQALAINLGYGNRCQIEDFVTDIDDLGNALHEDAMGLLWSLLNTERAADILNTVTNILKGEDYWNYLSALGKNLTRDHKAEVMQILARYEYNSVTHVPWALELYATKAPQALKASDNGLVHKALVSLLDRATKKGGHYTHHYVVDINGTVLEVLPGYLGTRSVLVRAAEL